MPMYVYKCLQCGHETLEFMKMCGAEEAPRLQCQQMIEYVNLSTDPETVTMDRCLAPLIRQVAQVHTDLQEFHTPIEMFSIGCNSSEEIRQMQEAGVSISDDMNDDLYGVPIAHNRKEKLKALKVAGFTEAK